MFDPTKKRKVAEEVKEQFPSEVIKGLAFAIAMIQIQIKLRMSQVSLRFFG